MKQLTLCLLILISALISSCEIQEPIANNLPSVKVPSILALGDSLTI